jgi:hypothetical protein
VCKSVETPSTNEEMSFSYTSGLVKDEISLDLIYGG